MNRAPERDATAAVPGARPRVLLLGATGRTGRHVLAELVARGATVRALVRSAARLPDELARHPRVEVVEADLRALGGGGMRPHLAGCDAVLSCLGHTTSLRGIFGPPRDLVARAAADVVDAAVALQPAAPIRFVLMSSVSVHRRGAPDARRGPLERWVLALLRGLVPPANDNQRAADVLVERVGPDHPAIAWVVVRPDTLTEGAATAFEVHEGLVRSLFRPATTRRSHVARFMADLATDPSAWSRWRGRMPVVVDAADA